MNRTPVRFAFRILAPAVVVGLLFASPAVAQLTPPLDTTPPYPLRGIDVSSWQGTINWAQVAADGFKPELVDYPYTPAPSPIPARTFPSKAGDKISFAFIRATRGVNQQDTQLQANIDGARANKIKIGLYHFAKPNLNSAAAEAKWFVDYAKAKGGLKPGDLRPVVDIESSNTDDPTSPEYGGSNGLSKTVLSQWVRDYSAAIKKAIGVDPIIYCNTNYATSYLDSTLNKQTLWVANYGWSQTDPDTGVLADWTFWQWSSKTRVNGIDSVPGNSNPYTYADADVFRGSAADLEKFTIPTPEPGAIAMLVTGGTLAAGWFGLRHRARSKKETEAQAKAGS